MHYFHQYIGYIQPITDHYNLITIIYARTVYYNLITTIYAC